jgi:hypothetical protein
MRTRLLLAAATLLVLVVPAAPAQADPIGGTGWTLVFNDDFDGTVAAAPGPTR